MPKKEITDYVIYKIICNDENIKECYVGSTSNFKVRKNHHKYRCVNNECNCKVYKTIRENGGWNNWSMMPIAEYKDLTNIQSRIKEEEHRVLLNAQMNDKKAYTSLEERKTDVKKYNEEYKNQNKEQTKIYQKEYRKANKESKRQQDIKHYEAHKEKIKERQKAYYEANKEKINEKRRNKI
jgi:hypothetical protein